MVAILGFPGKEPEKPKEFENGKTYTLADVLGTMNRKGRRKFLKDFEKQAREMKCSTAGCYNYREKGRYCKECSEKRRNGII